MKKFKITVRNFYLIIFVLCFIAYVIFFILQKVNYQSKNNLENAIFSGLFACLIGNFSIALLNFVVTIENTENIKNIGNTNDIRDSSV